MKIEELVFGCMEEIKMNENEALTLLKKILDMTNRNALEWNADVTENGNIKYFSKIPNTEFQIIIFEINVTPKVFILNSNYALQVNLKSFENTPLSKAEKITISIITIVKSQIHSYIRKKLKAEFI